MIKMIFKFRVKKVLDVDFLNKIKGNEIFMGKIINIINNCKLYPVTIKEDNIIEVIHG